jgi:hypothetical protein
MRATDMAVAVTATVITITIITMTAMTETGLIVRLIGQVGPAEGKGVYLSDLLIQVDTWDVPQGVEGVARLYSSNNPHKLHK